MHKHFPPSKATDIMRHPEESKAGYKSPAPLQRPEKIHFSERVELKSDLKAKGRALKSLKKEETAEIWDTSEEAHHLLIKLANQDENSADVFEDEYTGYQEQLKSDYDSLKSEVERLVTQYPSSEMKKLSRQEQSKLIEKAKTLKDKVKEKQKMLKELTQDKAWQPYIVLMDQEFEDLQKSLLKLNNL